MLRLVSATRDLATTGQSTRKSKSRDRRVPRYRQSSVSNSYRAIVSRGPQSHHLEGNLKLTALQALESGKLTRCCESSLNAQCSQKATVVRTSVVGALDRITTDVDVTPALDKGGQWLPDGQIFSIPDFNLRARAIEE